MSQDLRARRVGSRAHPRVEFLPIPEQMKRENLPARRTRPLLQELAVSPLIALLILLIAMLVATLLGVRSEQGPAIRPTFHPTVFPTPVPPHAGG